MVNSNVYKIVLQSYNKKLNNVARISYVIQNVTKGKYKVCESDRPSVDSTILKGNTFLVNPKCDYMEMIELITEYINQVNLHEVLSQM